MKVIDLEKEADKKRYGLNSLLRDIEKIHEKEGIELIAVVYKKKNGDWGYGTTYGNPAELLGLMALGKLDFINDAFYE